MSISIENLALIAMFTLPASCIVGAMVSHIVTWSNQNSETGPFEQGSKVPALMGATLGIIIGLFCLAGNIGLYYLLG